MKNCKKVEKETNPLGFSTYQRIREDEAKLCGDMVRVQREKKFGVGVRSSHREKYNNPLTATILRLSETNCLDSGTEVALKLLSIMVIGYTTFPLTSAIAQFSLHFG